MQMSCQCLFVHEHCLNCDVDTCYWPVRLLPQSPSFYLYKAPPPFSLLQSTKPNLPTPPSPLSFHIQNLSLPTHPPLSFSLKNPTFQTPLLSPSVYNPPPPPFRPLYSSLRNPTFPLLSPKPNLPTRTPLFSPSFLGWTNNDTATEK